MNRETSIYLDIVRFGAAAVVFLGHVSGQRISGGMLWQIGPYMSEAVTIFFVLSGFVIGYVTDRRETTANAYAASRLARIYSVALPALVLTFALDAIGRAINAPVYSITWGYHAEGQAWQFLSGLLFVHRLWFAQVPQGSDLPYWSLGFEVWYYVVFGLILFTRRWALWLTLAMLAIGPVIAAMFPIWLLGVAAYRLTRVPIRTSVGAAMCLGAAAAWIAYELWSYRRGRPLIGLPPSFLLRPELLQDYLVAALFAIHLVGFNVIAPLLARPMRLIGPAAKWTAGATFTLYLMHLPIAQFLTAVSPWPHASMPNRALIVCGTLAAVLALAEVTERRKKLWRSGFEKMFAIP